MDTAHNISPFTALEDIIADALEAAAAALPPITLAEMDGVKLLNRVDTKYVTSEAVLLQLLARAKEAGYRALEAEGVKLTPYNSIYYDTPFLQMFLDHHNKRLVRQKIRTRVYVNSGDTYLEIKRKNNHGRTKKKRIGIAAGELMDFGANPAAVAFVEQKSDYTAAEISPSLETEFTRITLVNPERTERLTIDTKLRFDNLRNGLNSTLHDAVIIELKQDGRATSQMKNILLDLRIKPLRVSKYCIGITLTDTQTKRNRFKPKVRAIEKIINRQITTI